MGVLKTNKFTTCSEITSIEIPFVRNETSGIHADVNNELKIFLFLKTTNKRHYDLLMIKLLNFSGFKNS